jgi:hypothetical protein
LKQLIDFFHFLAMGEGNVGLQRMPAVSRDVFLAAAAAYQVSRQ